LVAARAIGGGQLLLLLLAGPEGPPASHFPGAGGSGAREYVGGALPGLVADDDRMPAHGDAGSERVAARAIGGGQLLLLRPGAGGSGAREHVGGALRGIVADSADDGGIPAHGDRISEHVAARAIGGGQLLLLR